MNFLILGSLVGALLGWLMAFLSVFLVLLVLVQRGKGGGLTGALGGPGGQSAFGSKAGDTFTLITIVVASIWGFTCAFTMWLLGTHAPKTTVQQTTVSAGPGDELDDDTTSGIVIPKTPDGDAGGLSGLLDPKSTETPSMELTPKEPETDAAGADTPAAESTDSTPAEPDTKADSGDAEPASGEDSNAGDNSSSDEGDN